MSKKLSRRAFILGYIDKDGEPTDAGYGTFYTLKAAKEASNEFIESLGHNEHDDNYIFELVPVCKAQVTPPETTKMTVKWANVESR